MRCNPEPITTTYGRSSTVKRRPNLVGAFHMVIPVCGDHLKIREYEPKKTPALVHEIVQMSPKLRSEAGTRSNKETYCRFPPASSFRNPKSFCLPTYSSPLASTASER